MFAEQLLYRLSHTSIPFSFGYFGDGGLTNCLLGLTSNLNPPELSLPNTQDYRHEPAASG
jgi:hypothetical protein